MQIIPQIGTEKVFDLQINWDKTDQADTAESTASHATNESWSWWTLDISWSIRFA